MSGTGTVVGRDPRFEELFEHQPWVRALAARLCAPGEADDLVQDTWVEALRSGRTARSPRAWLGGIVRHLRRRALRTDQARTQREQRSAHEAHSPSPELLLARAELQRRVLAAVARLDEPYRVVVLLHYYEGCSSEAIAERLGCPSSTVRNRLARAHRQLRHHLDRDQDGGTAWSALFAPGLAVGSTKGLALGGVVMKVQVTAAAAVAVALAATAWFVIGGAGSPALRPDEPAADTRLAAASTPVPGALPAVEAAPGSDRTPARAAQVERVLVWGALLGGERLESGEIELYDEFERPRPAAVGANATWSIFGIAPGRYRIRARFARHLPLDEELVLGDDLAEVRHDLTLVPSRVLPVRFVSLDDGKPLELPRDIATRMSVVASREPPGARLAAVVESFPTWSGSGRYHRAGAAVETDLIPAGAHGVLEVLAPLPVYASCVLRTEVVDSQWIRGGESELVFALDPLQLESRLGALVLLCIDGRTGQPIADAWFGTSFRNGGGQRSRTGPDGRATLTRLAPGMQILEVEAASFARCRRWVRIEPGQTLDLGTLELWPATRLLGRVVDSAGHGVATEIAAFPLRTLDSPRSLDVPGHARSTADGAFELFGVEPGPVRLLVDDPDWAVTALDIDAAMAESVEIRLERGTDVALRAPRGVHTPVECLLLDGSSQPLFFARIMNSRRLKLRPGRYELCTVVDESIVERRALDVREAPLVVDVSSGR